MKAVKLLASSLLVAASLFIFSACEKDPVEPTPDPTPTPGQEDQTLDQILVGQWNVTASEEQFQYTAGGEWSPATDALVGETIVFNADKTGWMYFEEEGAFTWKIEGNKLLIDNQGFPITGTINKINNNNRKLHLEKDRYVGDITVERK